MQTRTLIVANPYGLHMRVAARVVQLVQKYGASVRLFSRDNRQADGGSVLDLMTLGVEQGTTVRVEVEGPGEAQVTKGLEELFNDGAGI